MPTRIDCSLTSRGGSPSEEGEIGRSPGHTSTGWHRGDGQRGQVRVRREIAGCTRLCEQILQESPVLRSFQEHPGVRVSHPPVDALGRLIEAQWRGKYGRIGGQS